MNDEDTFNRIMLWAMLIGALIGLIGEATGLICYLPLWGCTE